MRDNDPEIQRSRDHQPQKSGLMSELVLTTNPSAALSGYSIRTAAFSRRNQLSMRPPPITPFRLFSRDGVRDT
jgi:hypothetical protein